VLEARIVLTDKKTANFLALPMKEETAIIKRLRMVNNEPVALETSYLPHKLYPEILKQDLTSSLTRITEEKYGLTLHRAEQIVRADTASKEEANLLKVKPYSAVLKVRRTSFLKDNRVAEYLEAVYVGNKYELRMELKGRWKKKQR
jgi:GntR family transcriptional regulator